MNVKQNSTSSQTRTETVVETPTSTNIATETVTPEAISSMNGSDNVGGHDAEFVDSEQAVGTSIWRILQLGAGLGFVLFGLLWWRSRTFHPVTKQV